MKDITKRLQAVPASLLYAVEVLMFVGIIFMPSLSGCDGCNGCCKPSDFIPCDEICTMEIIFQDDGTNGPICGYYSSVKLADNSTVYHNDGTTFIPHSSSVRPIDIMPCITVTKFDDAAYRDEFLMASSIGAKACYQRPECQSPLGKIRSMLVSGQSLLGGFGIDKDRCVVQFRVNLATGIWDPFCAQCCL